jgi:hypothetical protein
VASASAPIDFAGKTPDGEASRPAKAALRKQKSRFFFREGQDPDKTPKIVNTPSERRAREVAGIVGDRSFRTFIATWDPKITRAIENLHMGDHVEDIKQVIYTFMVQPRCRGCQPRRELQPGQRCKKCRKTGCNGLEAYDPRRASFSVYVLHLVVLQTLNYRNKRDRDRLVLSGSGLDPEMQNERRVHDPWERANFRLQFEELASVYDDQPGDGFFDPQGRLVTRDRRTVLELLLEGHTRPDLARMLRCTVAEVDEIILLLRDSDDVRALLTVIDEET